MYTNLNNVILIVGICLCQFSCKGQEDKKVEHTNIKRIIMKKIDITEFEKNKKNEADRTVELIKGDSLIKYFEDELYIRKESMKLEENLKKNEIFNKESLNLIREGESFFNFPIFPCDHYLCSSTYFELVTDLGSRFVENYVEKEQKVA